MPRVFGTDGVRGLANGEVTAELALDLSVAAARVIIDHGDYDRSRERPLAVVGRDPRISGQFLEHAVVAGLASAGVDVLRLRVLPTPGVAYLTAALDADLGVVISASHNPMPDNGIKFLARGGVKLDDAVEAQIEELLGERVGSAYRRRCRPGASRTSGPIEEYVDHLLATLDLPLTGLKVVVDCANGAATDAAPLALRAAGAEVVVIGDRARRAQHQRGLRLHLPGAAAARRGRARRRCRCRPRRRRGPLPGGRPRRAMTSTETSCSAILALALRRGRRSSSTTPSWRP